MRNQFDEIDKPYVQRYNELMNLIINKIHKAHSKIEVTILFRQIENFIRKGDRDGRDKS